MRRTGRLPIAMALVIAIVGGAGCTDKGIPLSELAGAVVLQVGAAVDFQGPGVGVVILPGDASSCPTLRTSSHASVDGLGLDRVEIGGFTRDKGGQAGACAFPQFTRIGGDVLIPAPTADTVVLADDSATWTVEVSNLRAQRGFSLVAPASAHVTTGSMVQIALQPGGETVTFAQVDFVLERDVTSNGTYGPSQFSVKTTDPGVTVSGDNISFIVPGGQAGPGRLVLGAQLSSVASRCDGVSACQVTYQYSSFVPVTMD